MSKRTVFKKDNSFLEEKAIMVRKETLRLTDICGSGHYGSAFSIVEILVTLYYQLLHLRPNNPNWLDRDRFTMGKGHAAIALYPILADLGFFSKNVFLQDFANLTVGACAKLGAAVRDAKLFSSERQLTAEQRQTFS